MEESIRSESKKVRQIKIQLEGMQRQMGDSESQLYSRKRNHNPEGG